MNLEEKDKNCNWKNKTTRGTKSRAASWRYNALAQLQRDCCRSLNSHKMQTAVYAPQLSRTLYIDNCGIPRFTHSRSVPFPELLLHHKYFCPSAI